MPEGPLSPGEFAALMAPLGPFDPHPAIAVGVSGGPHSLALGLLAHRWAAGRGGSALALVVDHGLRPESGAEAAGVAAMLARAGIAVRIIALGLPPGRRLQERAREGRLAAMLAACAQAGRPWLLLGHHRGDQAETLLFRGLRGSGAAGLAGMAAVRVAPEALVLRPLLTVPPARLEAQCAAAGLQPVRDPSNRDRRFARIRLRTALAASGRGGATEAALALAAQGFARRRMGVEHALAARLAASATFERDGAVRLDRAAFRTDALAVALLGRLVRLLGGGRHAPSARDAARLLDRGQGTLGGCWLRPAAGGTWLLRPAPPAARDLREKPVVPLAGAGPLGYGPLAYDQAAPPEGGAVT